MEKIIKLLLRSTCLALAISFATSAVMPAVIHAQQLSKDEINSIYLDTVWYKLGAGNGSDTTNPGGTFDGGSCYSALAPTVIDRSALAAAIDAFIKANSLNGKTSPLYGLGLDIVNGALSKNVNPLLIVGIGKQESNFGTNTSTPLALLAYQRNNAFGNLISVNGSQTPRTWPSWQASVNSSDDEANLLATSYIGQGLTDIGQVIYKYAPPPNDTTGYIASVKQTYSDIIASAGSALDCTGSGSGGPIDTSSFIFYSQFDPRWTNKPYGDPSLGDIGQSGCGPTSMAMVVTNLTGRSITPDIIAGKFGQYHIPGNGSDWALFPAVAQTYGLQIKYLAKDVAAAAQTIKNGSLVVAAGQGSPPFTAGGHILVLRALSNGEFLLGDPNTTVPPQDDPKNKTPISPGVLVSAGLQGLWALSK